MRDIDGLALSSRNGYLDEKSRAIAPNLYRLLNEFAKELQSDFNIHSLSSQIDDYTHRINETGFKVDYLQVFNDKLQKPNDDDKHLVILSAAYLDKTRLLDNIEITL